ncbi:uncharacterized protein LOC127714874 [Mytilus californianus]|uniref:uncharacterized protein LOC127714874 n=1 Tax=Mytilus californianus TaxID=6549 RepID=UPI002245454E|nr:uncharacterized protein LOC127714874 [Mytilus californianus]
MDSGDKRRYLVVGSVILEIVSPLLRKRLEDNYKSKGFGCLQDFTNSLPVKHILFHLRHKNSTCCVNKTNCVNQQSLPLNYSQWNLIYTAGSKKHNCHCKYTANPISLNDLDLTLLTLILLSCCNLSSNEGTLISHLREFKNNYLSHNTHGAISETEYNTLWTDLTTYVLKLDPSKQNDLVIIQNRPLDSSLCEKYVTCLLDVHVILEKIETKMDATAAEIWTKIGNSTAELLATMGINTVMLMAKIEEMLHHRICQRCKRNINDQDKPGGPIQPYKLGQSIFTLHHQTDLTSVLAHDWLFSLIGGFVPDIVMMDDGRLVIRLPHQNRILICNTDGSKLDCIHVQGQPLYVTAFNNSTVAVTLDWKECIEMYDINSKLKLKSIPVPEMRCVSDITTINNKLVVCGDNCLQIIDDQTGEVVQTIQTDRHPFRVHGSGDRIFYFDHPINNNKTMYWYSYTDERHHTLTLPSPPRGITTLQDESLYVGCKDESVQHVSADGKQYKTVTTKGMKELKCPWMPYNSKQRKLVILGDQMKIIKVFHEN